VPLFVDDFFHFFHEFSKPCFIIGAFSIISP